MPSKRIQILVQINPGQFLTTVKKVIGRSISDATRGFFLFLDGQVVTHAIESKVSLAGGKLRKFRPQRL